MASDSLTQQHQLTFESPSKRTCREESPPRTGLLEFGTPPRTELLEFRTPPPAGLLNLETLPAGLLNLETLPAGLLEFGTPPPAGLLEFGTPPPAGLLNLETLPAIKKEEEEEFIPKDYICSPMSPIKSAGSLDPLEEFCSNLVCDKIFAISLQAYPQPKSPPSGEGSFFLVHPGKSPNTVEKIADFGSNNSKKDLGPKPSRALMTKTDFLALLDAIRRSHGNPQVVKTYEMYFSHVSKDNGVLTLVQEECFPLPKNMDGLLGLIQCVIALYRAGLPISDVKPANFMVTDDGRVVCVDLDLRKPKKGVYKFVVSAEYTHTIEFYVSEQFKQLLLVFLETLGHPIVDDRKLAFGELYEQKGLLQSYFLLSSDKSISETTIDDFAEVLRNIGLSDEDNAYLVGLLTPPAFSQ
jgi:hypothetical protein